jgi:trimethylamine--corrinoid protein Co-methyltransferase
MVNPSHRRAHSRGHRDRDERPLAKQPRWQGLRNVYPPYEILSGDAIEAIHLASLDILERIGVAIQSPLARELCREHGAELIDGVRLRFDRSLVETGIASAPNEFVFSARNRSRNVRLGNGWLAFATVSGPPNCSDLERGRRSGTLADLKDFLRLSQAFNIVHLLGGYMVEPLDIAVPVRHLEAGFTALTLSDKIPRVYCHTPQRTRDMLELVRLSHGLSVEHFCARHATFAIINTNSPLQLDAAMAEGIITMAQWNQPTIITPFTLAGAMAPVTLIGALAQQNAEALVGILISQFARPGAPVVYGAFTTNVNMRTGSPAFGTPEYAKAALISGQLARRYRLPFRSSNINTANCVDAQAAYESMMATWAAITGGVNFLHQSLGWLEGGLTASLEKFVIDVEMLQMFAAFLQPETVDTNNLAVDAVAAIGPGGHFFASPHTLERYETAFYSPLLSDWRNYQSWCEGGSFDTTQRAAVIARRVIADYREPPIDPAIRETMRAFVDRRSREGGAPVN